MSVLTELSRYLKQVLKAKGSLKERMQEYLSYWTVKRDNCN